MDVVLTIIVIVLLLFSFPLGRWIWIRSAEKEIERRRIKRIKSIFGRTNNIAMKKQK